jgi:hypothetical protein
VICIVLIYIVKINHNDHDGTQRLNNGDTPSLAIRKNHKLNNTLKRQALCRFVNLVVKISRQTGLETKANTHSQPIQIPSKR